jgi:hypothetical protein
VTIKAMRRRRLILISRGRGRWQGRAQHGPPIPDILLNPVHRPRYHLGVRILPEAAPSPICQVYHDDTTHADSLITIGPMENSNARIIPRRALWRSHASYPKSGFGWNYSFPTWTAASWAMRGSHPIAQIVHLDLPSPGPCMCDLGLAACLACGRFSQGNGRRSLT